MDNLIIPSDLTAMTAVVWTWTVEFLPRLISAIAILVLGYLLSRWAGRITRKLSEGSRTVDETLGPVTSAVVRNGLMLLVIIAALGQLGISTASILAALGGLLLAIGLALQGTLSNIAAGIMLLWLRPFRVGDYIEAGGISGTVREVNLFATRIDTLEELFRFVPNSDLWNQPILNYTRNPTRMMNVDIGISYDSDVDKAREILLALCKEEERVLEIPEPLVFVKDYADSAVLLTWRAHIPTAQYWPTHRALLEAAKKRFDVEGIEIPFPQRVLHFEGGQPPQPAQAVAA